MAERARSIPPGPPGRFLVGNTFAYIKDPLGFLTRAAREYGDVVRLRLGDTTAYSLNHPALIDDVVRGHPDDFIKDKLTRMLAPTVGNGLLTSEGDFWRRQRKLAQPAFQHSQVEQYGQAMVALTEQMLAGWHDGAPREVHSELTRLTLGIVARTLFDADVAADSRAVGQALNALMAYYVDPAKWLRIREYLPFPSTIRFRLAIRRLNRIIYAIIRRRREARPAPGQGSGHADLLSRLLLAQDDEGARMTDRQLRDEAVTLFLAGHETTALTLCYSLYLLASHPEADARLAAELSEVLDGRAPTVADIPRLKFTDAVIKEAMRLYPPAWSIGREAIVDVEVGGYHAPKGTQFFLPQWVVHRDPRWWDDPEAFRPERWENDLSRKLPRCAYFPFGDGARICIGQHFAQLEAVLVLATIAQRWRLALVPGRPLELVASITLRPKAGIVMVPRLRETAAFRAECG